MADHTYREWKQLIKKAALLSKQCHEGQLDKGGHEYYLHPKYVSEHVQSPECKIVGYLHDLLEDTECTEEKLKEFFDDDIVEAVVAITRKEGENYFDFIKRVKTNETASRVKFTDIMHNCMLNRIENPTDKDRQRIKKYRKALRILNYDINYEKTHRYQCHCCGNYTHTEPTDGNFNICPVCFWEDDNIQNGKIHYRAGANQPSLYTARKNYLKYGASERSLDIYVRKPYPFEEEGRIFSTKTMSDSLLFLEMFGLTEEEAKDKVIQILHEVNFCKEQENLAEWDEFAYGVLQHEDIVKEWGERYDLSKYSTASDLMLYLTTD